MNCAPKLAMLAVSLLALLNSANAADLVYGKVYHVQNGYANWAGGYLDVDGAGCQGNVYCVSTASSSNRDHGSGSWMIKSATGKADGTPVNGNDQIYLVNQYATPTYLDVNGAGCQGNLLCVSTSSSSNRDLHSGTWLIIKDQWGTGPIAEQSTIRLMNGYADWGGGYLDVNGAGCQGNVYCVSTARNFNRDIGSTTWRLAAAAGTAVRKSILDLSAPELMSLRRGVAKMMARNTAPRGSADYRRSWIYWANMHSHFGNDCAGPIMGNGMSGVQLWTASNADETATWCKCQHRTPQFLTWHRMYLWYFERVLQEAAGDPSLRLPYWDYEKNGALPQAYRDATYVNESGQTVPNPLRVDARQPGLNNGTSSLAASVTSTAGAMPATSYGPFNSALEITPHGAVHCAVVTGGCPNGLMGSVPVSALDPIFYAHHTNIDRLYECWLKVNESARLPNNQGQLDTLYTFVDADGSTPQRRVRDMLTTAQLGYSYAAGEGCPVAPVVAMADRAEVTLIADQPLASVGATRLDRGVTTVPLAVAPSAREALSARQGVSAPARTYLVIEGLQYDETPGGLYNVYLQGAGGRREQAGVINFFNLVPSKSDGHAGHTQTQATFRFDVTEAIRRLNVSGDAQPALVFEPTTGLTGSSPEAVASQMSAQANVRFESARLVSGP
jgi:Common central domain of tyrosinase